MDMTLSSVTTDTPQPFLGKLGHLQMAETRTGKAESFESRTTSIAKIAKDNQYWVKATCRTADGERAVLLKIPYDAKSTVIKDTLRQGSKNFEYIYIETAGSGSSKTEKAYKPDGDVSVDLDESTGLARISFICKITDTQSGQRHITGHIDWTSERDRLDNQAVFKWTDGIVQQRSTHAWLFYGDTPEGKAWMLIGEKGSFPKPDYQQWVIVIYCDDPTVPIHNETFVHLDGRSNFYYYVPFPKGYEGEYSVTLTLNPQTLHCSAKFSNYIPDIVNMTEGSFITKRT